VSSDSSRSDAADSGIPRLALASARSQDGAVDQAIAFRTEDPAKRYMSVRSAALDEVDLAIRAGSSVAPDFASPVIDRRGPQP